MLNVIDRMLVILSKAGLNIYTEDESTELGADVGAIDGATDGATVGAGDG